MRKNFKILIEAEDGENSRVEIYGTKLDIMNGIAHLVNNLLSESNLSKENIEYAVKVGLMNEDERKAELKREKAKSKELDKAFEEVMRNILNLK